MPSIITHAIVGISSGVAVSKKQGKKPLLALSICCAVVPDADVLGFKLGIPYAHNLGHRGFFHSIFFALVPGLLAAAILCGKEKAFFKKWWLWVLYFFLISASHGILDAFTNGGLGIALLAPFDNERYFFWATPISVSPLHLKSFMGIRGINILKNEFLWVWLPSFFLLFACRIGRFYRANLTATGLGSKGRYLIF